MRDRRFHPAIAATLMSTLVLGACGGGARPELVADQTLHRSAVTIAAQFPSAPAFAVDLPTLDIAPAPTGQDAMDEWSARVGITYRGSCGNPLLDTSAPADGPVDDLSAVTLCSTTASQPNTLLLGPATNQVWYVVSLDAADGDFRVVDVARTSGT